MNILHITTFLQGGAGKIIKDIAAFQKENGSNVSIVTSYSEEPGYCNYEDYLDYFNRNSIKVYKIDSTFKRDIYLNLNVANKVREILINENIDIIHAHAAVPAMVGIIARAGMKKYIPVIQTMHGWGTNKKSEHEKMDVIIMNGLDKIVSVSKSDKRLMISKGIAEEKITTIYNGIEDNVNYDLAEDEILRDIRLHKSEGYTILGCIGSICARKNQKLLIEAINNISKDTKIYVVFIGEGDIIAELQGRVHTYGLDDKIKFFGYRKNASKYIRLFDYFVFTSLSEGFSIAMLEGFREKIPIIASDIPAFSECIIDNKTGYLYKSNDSESLKNLIEKVNNKKSECIIDNAYLEFKKSFTLKKMLSNYVNLYSSILNSV